MNEPVRKRSVGVWLWCALGALILGIVLLTALRAPEEGTVPPEPIPVAIRALEIVPRRVDDTVRLPGHVEALREVWLSAEKPGVAVATPVEEGEAVRKGQLLMQLDDRLWAERLRQAEIDLREAEKDVDRWKALSEAGAVSQDEWDAVRTRLETASLARDVARVHLDQCAVRSPIDGVLNERAIEPGEYAKEGVPFFHVVDAAKVKVRLDVPEADIASVSLGAPTPFTVKALDDGARTGAVDFIAAAADSAAQTFRVELLADNPDGALRPGMMVEARLDRGALEDALVVPLSAVIPKKGEHVVFVVRDGRVVRRTVQLGVWMDGEVVVRSGLAPGERIAVEGHRALTDGARVEDVAP